MVLTQKMIDAYLNEFRDVTGEEIPVRALDYFNKKQYEILHEKDITSELDGYGMDEDAILEIDIEKMTMLIDFSNDGYFDEAHMYLPLATINDQTCYIGIMAGDPAGKIYFFDYQEGYTEQEYTLDELLKKFK